MGLSEADHRNLKVLARQGEYTSILRLIDQLVRISQNTLADNINLPENENNALKGEVKFGKRLYKWLANLYDEAHKQQ